MIKDMNMQPNSKSYALQTDRYEFTMLDALVQAGQAEKRSVFEVFSRDLPNGRPFGVLRVSTGSSQKLTTFLLMMKSSGF